MFKHIAIPRTEELDQGIDVQEVQSDQREPRYSWYLDTNNPTEWDQTNGEYIDYSVLCAAWEDEAGNGWVVRKSNAIDDRLPEDWLVLYYDAVTDEVTRQVVERIDTLHRTNHSLIHILIERLDDDAQRTGSSVLEFYVNDLYQPMTPGAVQIFDSKNCSYFASQVNGVEYDQDNLPLFSDEKLLSFGYDV